MNEQEWLACTDPEPMLEFIQSKSSDRKYRLFGVACVVRLVHPDGYSALMPVLRTVERYTEGGLSDTELVAIGEVIPDTPDTTSIVWACRHLCLTDQSGNSVAAASSVYAADAASEASGEEFNLRLHLRHTPTWGEERQHQSLLLRDILGNPFRPVTVDPSWLTSDVVALASQMYESHDFTPMPILADALQDAGCDDAEVLDHCRGPGPHFQSCNVLDLIIGKS